MSKLRTFDIWIPKNNHPHWRPDEQTYAVEPPGYYNPEIYEKIAETVELSATHVVVERELLQNIATLLDNPAITGALANAKLKLEEALK